MIRTILHHRHRIFSQCLTQAHLHLRNLCSRITHFDTSQTDLHNDMFHIESAKFRNTLYPDSGDIILNQLKSCNSIQQVLDIYVANKQNLTSQHLCQAILILRDIQKVFNKYYLNDFSVASQHQSDTENLSKHSPFQVFQKELVSHPVFEDMLNQISNQCSTFNLDEIVCIILYLRFLGLNLRHVTLQRLISHVVKTFESSIDSLLSYQTLSRYFSVFKFDESLYSVLHLSRILPTVIAHLDKCPDIYCLGQMSVCLEVVKDLMSSDLQSLFRTRLLEILQGFTIESPEDSRSLMKILLFLNESFWNEETASLIQQMLLTLSHGIHLLDLKEIIILQRVFSSNLEPHLFLQKLQQRAESVMKNCKDLRAEPSLSTMMCMAPMATPKQKKYIEKILLAKLQEPGNILNTMSTLATLVDLLRSIESDNHHIHTVFWEKVLVLLQDEQNLSFLMFFTMRYIKRYLQKRNFRYPRFEEFVTEVLWGEFQYAGPNPLAQYGAVILKFSPDFVRSKIPTALYTKLVDNTAQMSLVNCFAMMDALTSMLRQPSRNKNIAPEFTVQFTHLERRLESRINQILDEAETLSSADCFHIFSKPICKHWQHIYEKIYAKIPASAMMSKLIYAACRHIIYSEHYSTTHGLLHKCVAYCEANRDVIIGFVVSYVLYTSYLCGYPLHTKHGAFLDAASSILLRDKDAMKSLVMVRATLSLAYFSALTPSLAAHIFSLPFLECLDEQMSGRVAGATAFRIRRDLMELNRAVCLDYAQYGIPWFHQKYADQVALAEKSSTQEQFSRDVHQVLVRYVGDSERVLPDSMSPYGQRIDFVLHLDKLGNPIAPRGPDRAQTRLAILLEQTSAQGPGDLRRRHLELQGYCVVRLQRKHWNALFMAEPKAKQVFLDQIFSQYRPMITSGEVL